MHVKKTISCWLWLGTRINSGYGMSTFNGKHQSAHRIAWQLFVGVIPMGFFVLHRCDVKLCVNPSHLFVGTQQDNVRDMRSKGRAKGNAKLTVAQVKVIRMALLSGETQASQAKKYNVSFQQISKISRNERWRQLHAGGEV